jgi:peroxin-6
MDRIVAQLLTEIDGLGKKPGMFTIGATNRPDLLDSALLRTGRFDKMIYLGVAKSVDERVKIIKAQTRKTTFAQDVDLESVASKIPENFTGADFSALTSEAYMIAVKQKIATIQTEIAEWKLLNQELISASEELLPGTYFQLKYPDDPAAQKAAAEVTVTQAHLLDALS